MNAHLREVSIVAQDTTGYALLKRAKGTPMTDYTQRARDVVMKMMSDTSTPLSVDHPFMDIEEMWVHHLSQALADAEAQCDDYWIAEIKRLWPQYANEIEAIHQRQKETR